MSRVDLILIRFVLHICYEQFFIYFFINLQYLNIMFFQKIIYPHGEAWAQRLVQTISKIFLISENEYMH